jgi:formylmethanofuran dehydrogenase subunit E
MAKVFVETNTEGEVIAWATSRGNEKEIEIEVENNHPIYSQNHFYFKLIDGSLIEDQATKEKIQKERLNRNEIRDLKQVLAETDYYVVRKIDENTPIPAEVHAKRAQARARLRQLGL